MLRHQYLLVLLVLLSFISISVAQTSTTETHNEDIIDLDHEIAQPTRAPGAPSRLESSPTTRPTPGIRIPPRTPRGDDMSRPRMTDRPSRTFPRDPATSRRMKRLTMMERRMLMQLFRKLFLLRVRTMEDQYPFGMPRWERRMLGWMMLNDLMMMMDVQAEEANEIAHMIEEQEEMEQSNNENIHDPHETETTEPEVEIEEAEPETEVADVEEHQVADPRDDPRLIDPTLIESEFEISAPYGGYGGGFGYGGYGGGYGGKKKGGYGGFGYGGGFGGKKGGYGGGYKKVPYKKVPYKKVPIKKGPPKKKGGFGGYGFGGGYI